MSRHDRGFETERGRVSSGAFLLYLLLLGGLAAFLVTNRGGGRAGAERPRPDFVYVAPSVRPLAGQAVEADPETGLPSVRGETLVGLAPGATRAGLERELSGLPGGPAVVGEIPNLGVVQVSFEGDASAVRRAIADLPSAKYAVPNGIVVPTRGFDDPVFGDPDPQNDWGLLRVRAPEAWDRTLGENVLVAVIDDGVNPGHPDLAGQVVKTWCTRSRSPDQTFGSYPAPRGVQQEGGHGTHVAGTIAAIAGNGLGTAGVAPRARILSIQCLSFDPAAGKITGSDAEIAAAINMAVGEGAAVINMSLGPDLGEEIKAALADPARRDVMRDLLLRQREKSGAVYRDALALARSRGVIVVVAAGNNDLESGWAPLAFSRDTIAVGAADSSDQRAWFSSYDDGGLPRVVDLCAPGVNVWSCAWPDGYEFKNGTSMAAPHVTGTVALLKSVFPSASLDEVRAVLVDTARPIRTDRDIGPALDAAAAVAEMSKRREGDRPAPPTQPKPPPDGPVEPPDAPWGGKPGDVTIIIDLGSGAGWLFDLVAFFVNLFFRSQEPEWGRFDEYGRIVDPPGIVAIGPPADLGGRTWLEFVWGTCREVRAKDGTTLEGFVVKSVDTAVVEARTARRPTEGTGGGGPREPEPADRTPPGPGESEVRDFVARFEERTARDLKGLSPGDLLDLVRTDRARVPGADGRPESEQVREEHLAIVNAILARRESQIAAIEAGADRGTFPSPFPKSLEPWVATLLLAHAYVEVAENGEGESFALKGRVLLERLHRTPTVYVVAKGIWPKLAPAGRVESREKSMGFDWAAARPPR